MVTFTEPVFALLSMTILPEVLSKRLNCVEKPK